jgi:hypothetical protein
MIACGHGIADALFADLLFVVFDQVPALGLDFGNTVDIRLQDIFLVTVFGDRSFVFPFLVCQLYISFFNLLSY